MNSENLEELSDYNWFLNICDIFRNGKEIQLPQIISILGKTDNSIKKENRGSKFLIPFDKRFIKIAINPDIEDETVNLPIEFLQFRGDSFILKKSEILHLFPSCNINSNYYDDSTELLFDCSTTDEYQFKAIKTSLRLEIEDFEHDKDYIFHNISFIF